MKAKNILVNSAILISLFAAGNANAGAIPYPNSGTENPVLYSFTATSDGDLVAYFYGSTAGYTNELSLLVNGVDTNIQGLNNQVSSIGDSLNFGHVNAGDSLIFRLNVFDTQEQWYSDRSMNYDGVNHVYSTDFAGDGFSSVPVGTFVSFEDLTDGGDLNYNDEDFVFTNVSTINSTNVPEPVTLALMGLGLAGMGYGKRRQTLKL